MLPTSAASKSTGVLFAFGAKLIFGIGAVFGPVIGLAGAVYGTNRTLDSATSATYNRLITTLIRNMQESSLSTPCTITPYETRTLGYLVTDYLDHMKHHIAKLADRTPTSLQVPTQIPSESLHLQ